MNYGEVKRLLKKNGCYFVEEGGRHEKWFSPITGETFSGQPPQSTGCGTRNPQIHTQGGGDNTSPLTSPYERSLSMKYVYPAVFTPEANDLYSIDFPDLHNCFTSGKGLSEAMEMAQDVLCMTLYDLEEAGQAIPAASDVSAITHDADEFTTLVACDTMEYRKLHARTAVKKTLSIPAWLNTMAEKQDINFSQVLQEALKEKLHVG